MKMKMFAALTAGMMLLQTAALPASAAGDFRSPLYIYSKTDCGIAVRLQGGVSAIRQIGSYPVTDETGVSESTIQLMPFTAAEQRYLDEMSETHGQSVTGYETYLGTETVMPHTQITDEVYLLHINIYQWGVITDEDIEMNYRNVINTIALDPDITYLGKAAQIRQCENIKGTIQVNAVVSDETEALLNSDPRFCIDETATERNRLTYPDIYIVKSTENEWGSVSLSDYPDFTELMKAHESEIRKISFKMALHNNAPCPGCHFGLEIYPPEDVLGDLNSDGLVDLTDAQLALISYTKEISMKGSPLTQEQRIRADVSADGNTDAADAQMILLYYVKNDIAHNPITWEELRAAVNPDVPAAGSVR